MARWESLIVNKVNLKKSLLITLSCVGLILSGASSWARDIKNSADDLKVKETTDLFSLAKEARDKKVPMLVMFTQRGCTYCAIVEQDFLIPMLRNREYDEKVVIRKMRVDNFDDVVDFDGKIVAADDLMLKYRAVMTPTVVFLDHNGQELSRRLIGLANEYYYGEWLDNAIDTSLSKLRPSSVALK